jgi:nucleoside-diphosphate-sugar epimerase
MADAAESDAAGGGTYFLAGPRDYSWDDFRGALEDALGHRIVRVPLPRGLVAPAGAIAEGLGRLVGRYPPINREKAREVRERWLASHARAADAFGYEPRVDLEDGLRETVDWYRRHQWL